MRFGNSQDQAVFWSPQLTSGGKEGSCLCWQAAECQPCPSVPLGVNSSPTCLQKSQKCKVRVKEGKLLKQLRQLNISIWRWFPPAGHLLWVGHGYKAERVLHASHTRCVVGLTGRSLDTGHPFSPSFTPCSS